MTNEKSQMITIVDVVLFSNTIFSSFINIYLENSYNSKTAINYLRYMKDTRNNGICYFIAMVISHNL